MENFSVKYVDENLKYYQDCALKINDFLTGIKPQTERAKVLAAKLANEMLTYVNKVNEGVFVMKQLGVENIILNSEYEQRFAQLNQALVLNFVLNENGEIAADNGLSVQDLYDSLNKYEPKTPDRNESKGDSK